MRFSIMGMLAKMNIRVMAIGPMITHQNEGFAASANRPEGVKTAIRGRKSLWKGSNSRQDRGRLHAEGST